MPFFFAWFIPMQLIWLISYTTYFQDPQGDAGRDGITITCFLTMVFYQVEIKAHLPKLLCTLLPAAAQLPCLIRPAGRYYRTSPLRSGLSLARSQRDSASGRYILTHIVILPGIPACLTPLSPFYPHSHTPQHTQQTHNCHTCQLSAAAGRPHLGRNIFIHLYHAGWSLRGGVRVRRHLVSSRHRIRHYK